MRAAPERNWWPRPSITAVPAPRNPLVKVNCSALSENLLESELFGHVRGAYTGAVKDKTGRFQLAHRGTIFLDEIGEVSPPHSVEASFGCCRKRNSSGWGDAETVKVDVRVIAATNRNLLEMVRLGEFREDLYYRLKVVETILPPLRNRRRTSLSLPSTSSRSSTGNSTSMCQGCPGGSRICLCRMAGREMSVNSSTPWSTPLSCPGAP